MTASANAPVIRPSALWVASFGSRPKRFHVIRHQLGENLCIGVRFEHDALGCQLFTERFEVLNNAIMDDSNLICRVGGGRSAHLARRVSPSGCGQCRLRLQAAHGPPSRPD